MKKLFTLLALIVITTINAQAPQGFNYQATVRNSSGALVINQNVLFKFNIMLNSQTSLPVYSETHQAPTDDLGQVNLTVGSGTATTGTFAGINWASGSYFLGIELNTGAGYVAMGTTQLLSVPYALYANNAGNSQSQGKTSLYLTGNINNAQAAAKIASELGPNTENIYILNTTQLTTVDLSLIQTASRISIKNNASLININLSGLTTIIDDFDINYNQNLTTVNINGLKSIFSGKFSIGFNVSLTNLSFPFLEYCEQINLTNNAINSSSVNSILNKFLTVLPLEEKEIILSGQNPSAPPTGQGLIDKQILIDSGNYVETDLENSDPTPVINTATQGTWRITSYVDSGTDETNHFIGYNFTFVASNVMTATNGTNTYTGTWSVVVDNSNEDNPSSDLDFNIAFASPPDFADLTNDWDVVSHSATTISLIDVSGVNGGTDTLVFTKN